MDFETKYRLSERLRHQVGRRLEESTRKLREAEYSLEMAHKSYRSLVQHVMDGAYEHIKRKR